MSATLNLKYTGGPANANPNLSLGGTGSSEVLLTMALNNLFDNTYPDDILLSDHISYRAVDLHNAGDGTALHVEFWIVDTPNTESIVHVWYESSPGQSIVNDLTEPTGASWSLYTLGSKLTLTNMAPDARHRLWLRKTVDQGALNINNDTATINWWYS